MTATLFEVCGRIADGIARASAREPRQGPGTDWADSVDSADSAGDSLLAVCTRLGPELASRCDGLRLLESPCSDRFFWEQPDAGLALVAEGALATLVARGPDRFRDLARRGRETLAALRIEREDDGSQAPIGPLLLGGFSFDPSDPSDAIWRGFPSARFVLPEHLFVRRGCDAWLITLASTRDDPSQRASRAEQFLERLVGEPRGNTSARRAAGFELRGASGMTQGPAYRVRADRSHADFVAQVQAARRAIAVGEFQKVVLARALDIESETPMSIGPFLAKLRSAYPACATFAIERAGSYFLGSTPELLISVEGRRVRTAAVAGSAPRGRGPKQDEQLGRSLRESKKEQEEHRFVVEALRDALAPACDTLEFPESPRLLRLAGIQHLETPMQGQLSTGPGHTLLELAERLHPSPAVGGVPGDAALCWMHQCEGLDRGWYAGPVGFFDVEGGGELRVALRSGVIRGSHARLFAGAGLVADSDPEAELEETRVKLRALLAPLTEI